MYIHTYKIHIYKIYIKRARAGSAELESRTSCMFVYMHTFKFHIYKIYINQARAGSAELAAVSGDYDTATLMVDSELSELEHMQEAHMQALWDSVCTCPRIYVCMHMFKYALCASSVFYIHVHESMHVCTSRFG